MAIRRSKTKSAEYTAQYTSMRGVDFSAGTGSDRTRYAYLENMYRDYESEKCELIESAPGFRKIASFGGVINAIHSYKNSSLSDVIVVHSKNNLYRFNFKDRDSISEVPSALSVRVRDSESDSCQCGADLFIFDGESIVKISDEGKVGYVGEGLDFEPYIPTCYVNGKEYEQRNLLTSKFFERYEIFSFDTLAFGSEGLKYRIISEENLTCAVIGIESGSGSLIQIPSYKTVGGKQYKVTGIEDVAFYENSEIEEVRIANGVRSIGDGAFAYCGNLKKVVLPEDMESIGMQAFESCYMLSYIYIGIGMKRFGEAAFDNCISLEKINYGGKTSDFSGITNFTVIGEGRTIVTNSAVTEVMLEIPVYSPAENIISVKIDGEESAYLTKKIGGIVSSVLIEIEDKNTLDGREIEIYGSMNPKYAKENSRGSNFITEFITDGASAIRGCTVCESFDGRIFLSGNKNFPNTVFYTSRDLTGKNNPSYFGALNYFNDGIGSYPVKSMLSSADYLAVFKAGDDGGGSIYYHTPKETDYNILPKIYPVSYIHTGLSSVGRSCVFFDEPVFISELGLTALQKKSLSLERCISVKSHNVNARLLTEDLSKIRFARWCGYLILSVNGNMYLADSRAEFTHEIGYTEYEWFYFTGIGTYKNDTRVYRYAEKASIKALTAHENADAVATGTVFSLTSNGNTYFYVTHDEKNYEVYPTEEFVGGDFSPATALLSLSDRYLFFGTESGDLCIFNNDLRGIAPKRISEEENFDEEEYARDSKRQIHPDFYSFASHAPRYALKTVKDNCSVPHLTKSTVKHSLVVKLESRGADEIILEVGTDKKGYTEVARLPGAPLDFRELDFKAFSFIGDDYATIPFSEKEKDWIEKDIAIYREAFASPFGVYSIVYRFNIKGKIKNT